MSESPSHDMNEFNMTGENPQQHQLILLVLLLHLTSRLTGKEVPLKR